MKKSAYFSAFFFSAISCFILSISMAHAEPMGHDEHKHDEMHKGGMHEGGMEGGYFKKMDTNGDGVVSKAEFDAAHDKHFKDMDTNNDGNLTPEEMKSGHRKNMEEGKNKRFDEADANHDGMLSREEAQKMPMLSRHFDEVDTNKDGKVSREELDASMEKMREKRGGKQQEQDKKRSGW